MRTLFILLAISGCILGASVRAPVTTGCNISLNKDLPSKNDPVLYKRGSDGKLTFILPEAVGKDDFISLRQGEEMVVACPGNKNALEVSGSPYASSSCVRDQTVKVATQNVATSGLSCSAKATASLLNTKKSCGANKGVLVQMGYDVEGWSYLGEVCHDIQQAASLYTTHTIYGAALAGKVNQAFRPGFTRGDKEFYAGFNPDQSYQQTHQDEVFTKLLGPKAAKEYLQPSKSFYLARGHLAPDADFIYGSWQLLTYFYLNAAPQWQSINAGSWLRVEDSMRKLGQKIGDNLDIATGTYGVLKLKADNGKEVPMYLEDGRLPVPELYWKIARNPRDGSCIAVVSTNNPFLTQPPKPICKDICEANGWPSLKSELNKGYVYCCSYSDFKKVVSFAPDLKCGSVLKF